MIDKNTIYSYFQTDDFPTEDQFRATWDSFWHKSESIPMSSISGLNQLFQQTATVAQLNNKANVDGSNIDVSAYQEKLNITNLIATAKEEVKTELLNGAPEAFDTLKEISDWISDDETAEGAILQAIQNEATARTEADNQKLDKGNYIGTAQDLYNYFEDKIDADYNCIPVVGNGASGKVLTNSVVSQIYGKVGIGIAGEASEKLEVGGNIKAINFKGQSIKFNLQASITPTSNTLVPKTDGSGLIWYNNSSVANNLLLLPTIFNYGYGSGNNATNSSYGKQSLNSNTSGSYNLAIGNQTMINNTTGSNNTAIGGDYTLGENTTGSSNTAVGNQALQSNSTGNDNTAVGRLAGSSATGNSNTFVGFSAGRNYTGSEATFVGKYSGGTGSYTVAVGFNAGINQSGGLSVYIGHVCAIGVTTGTMNVAIGNEAMSAQHTTSSQNVAIGWDSMTCWSWGTSGNTSSNYNTCLGYKSGNGSLVGDYNVFIGHGVSTTASPTSRVSKRIVIGTNSSMVGSTIDDYPISVNMEAPVPYGKHNYKNLPLRFQLPNLTKTQRDALASKTVGEMIWQTDSGNSGIRVFDGTNWLAVQTVID